jgi:outer membrane scaffolding protein for murein synthesis (MipA/OmpV family)
MAALLTLWGWAGAAAAQTAPAEPKPLWEVGVVAGGVSTPAYPASADRNSRALVVPFFIYRGEVLRAEQGNLGARLLHSEGYEVDMGFAASLPAASKDVVARSGMPDLGFLAEFGPRLKIKLAGDGPEQQLRLELPLRTVWELKGGAHPQGLAFEPELNWSQRLPAGWGVSTSAGLVWGNRKLNQYFYGVDAAYSNADRKAYSADAGLIVSRLGLTVTRKLSPDLRLLSFARLEHYGSSANRDSPLYKKDTGTSLGVALAWTLGRSAQTGRE